MTKFGPMDIDYRRRCMIMRRLYPSLPVSEGPHYPKPLAYNVVVYGLAAKEVRDGASPKLFAMEVYDIETDYSSLSVGGRTTYLGGYYGAKGKRKEEAKQDSGPTTIQTVAPVQAGESGSICDGEGGEVRPAGAGGEEGRRVSHRAADAESRKALSPRQHVVRHIKRNKYNGKDYPL